jgi:hypothetical protein
MTEQHTATRALTTREVVKPTPVELMEDTGTGLDFGTRPDRMPGYLTPTDRFFVRNHAPTPRLDAATWTLRIEAPACARPSPTPTTICGAASR